MPLKPYPLSFNSMNVIVKNINCDILTEAEAAAQSVFDYRLRRCYPICPPGHLVLYLLLSAQYMKNVSGVYPESSRVYNMTERYPILKTIEGVSMVLKGLVHDLGKCLFVKII